MQKKPGSNTSSTVPQSLVPRGFVPQAIISFGNRLSDTLSNVRNRRRRPNTAPNYASNTISQVDCLSKSLPKNLEVAEYRNENKPNLHRPKDNELPPMLPAETVEPIGRSQSQWQAQHRNHIYQSQKISGGSPTKYPTPQRSASVIVHSSSPMCTGVSPSSGRAEAMAAKSMSAKDSSNVAFLGAGSHPAMDTGTDTGIGNRSMLKGGAEEQPPLEIVYNKDPKGYMYVSKENRKKARNKFMNRYSVNGGPGSSPCATGVTPNDKKAANTTAAVDGGGGLGPGYDGLLLSEGSIGSSLEDIQFQTAGGGSLSSREEPAIPRGNVITTGSRSIRKEQASAVEGTGSVGGNSTSGGGDDDVGSITGSVGGGDAVPGTKGPGSHAAREWTAWQSEKSLLNASSSQDEPAVRPISNRKHLSDCMIVENDTQLPVIDILAGVEDDAISLHSNSVSVSTEDITPQFYQNNVPLLNAQDRPNDGLELYTGFSLQTPMNKKHLHSFERAIPSNTLQRKQQLLVDAAMNRDSVTVAPVAQSVITTISNASSSTNLTAPDGRPSSTSIAAVEASARLRKVPERDQTRYVLALEAEELVRQEEVERLRQKALQKMQPKR
mmetsp:Transcript_28722/g.48193  ORF Transcript_28722/g.48193 Transcript_28722/m.48193 type:complete len:608 (+) Transcript_28722:254-2077(+)